jgi:hypothetical protein
MDASSEELKPVYGNQVSHENAAIRNKAMSHCSISATGGYDIFTLVKKEEALLKDLLIGLGNEIHGILDENSRKTLDPQQELEILFRQLYRLFQDSPHYLTLIFDKDLRAHCVGSDEVISRMKKSASDYLKGVIDRGKEQGCFTNQIPTESLVADIIGSFRGLMNDVRLADKMMADLKKFQTEND